MNSIISTGRPAILGALLLCCALTSRLHGQAQVDDHNPVGVTGIFEGAITTGCAYNLLSHSATRAINDIVVPGSIGKYPLKLTRYYTSRRFGANGLGPGWSFEYSWSFNGSKLTYPNGNVIDSLCQAPVGVSDRWESCDPVTGICRFRLADGGTVVFDGNGTATQIIDPYRQTTILTYTNGLLSRVTEPGGRYLQFTYGESQLYQMGPLLTRVEAHGLGNATVTDWVNYTYASKPTGGATFTQMKVLISVTYSDNTSAAYTYEADNAPDNPGRNSWRMFPLVSTCHDPRYKGPMRRIAYDYDQGGPHGAITAERCQCERRQ